MGAADWLLDLLYPPKCVLCGALLRRGETEICNACRLKLPVFDGVLTPGPYLSGAAAALYYEGTVRDSLLRYKFGGMEQYAACYGRLLAAAVSAALPLDAVDAVTWVPVSRKRRRRRGYDQAMLLARAAARLLERPLTQTLVKIRDNPAQSTLDDPAARRANVLGVYRPAGTEAAGRTLLLVDDIWTTGATASEAARVLLTAGADAVFGAALAAKRNRE